MAVFSLFAQANDDPLGYGEPQELPIVLEVKGAGTQEINGIYEVYPVNGNNVDDTCDSYANHLGGLKKYLFLLAKKCFASPQESRASSRPTE